MRIPPLLHATLLASGLLALAGCSMMDVPFAGVEAQATSERSTSGVTASLDDGTHHNRDRAAHGLTYYADGGGGEKGDRTGDLPTEGAPGKPRQPSAQPARPARKMIYNSTYAVLVPAIDEAIKALLQQAEAFDGYLAERSDASLTLRIPAARFQEFTAGIAAYGRILSQSMSARDVTSQHQDLAIRLENAEKSRRRLLALLEKATVMKDILEIEAALHRLTSEIEQMQGQLKLLDNQVAFSTVTVTFKSNAPPATAKRQRSNSRFGWINRIGIQQDLRRFQP